MPAPVKAEHEKVIENYVSCGVCMQSLDPKTHISHTAEKIAEQNPERDISNEDVLRGVQKNLQTVSNQLSDIMLEMIAFKKSYDRRLDVLTNLITTADNNASDNNITNNEIVKKKLI